MSEASSHKPLPVPRRGSSSLSQGPLGGSSSARAGAADGERTVISSRPPAPNLEFQGGLPAESASQWIGEQLGQFVLQEFVGGGGMGIVFRAIDTTLDREVAVKVLAADQSADEESLRRFRNEAQSAARLNHDNIAHVFYVGEDRGVHYIVFEFIEGVNIRDLVEQHGPLPLEEAVSYTYQVAQALEHASQRNVIHRDIKPSNVLISPDGKAKLVDMGLARLNQLARSDDLTASGVTLGTFDYISPEQARDPRNADVRSDLYSLGCSFFFMLTGRPPFPEGTVLQKLLQHQGDSPPDPREFRPGLPADVTHILARLLAKNPAQRYQQPAELIDDLNALGSALGIQLGGSRAAWVTPRRSYPFSQWQHHLPWAVSIVALLLIVLGLDWYWSVDSASMPNAASVRRGSDPPASKPIPQPPPPVDPQPLPANTIEPAEPAAPIPAPAGDAADSAPLAGQPSAPSGDSRDEPPNPLGVLGQTVWNALVSNATPPGETTPTVRPPADVSNPSQGPNEASADKRLSRAATTTGNPSRENVLTVSDEFKAGNYASLQAACSEATDGDIIELRYNGPRIERRPIEVSNIKLTLRAAENFQPVVVFEPEPDWNTKYAPAMFSMAGGQLSATDVHWEFVLPKNNPADWALFETRRCERLEFKNCTLSVRGQTDYRARVAFFDVKAAPTTISMDMGSSDTDGHVVAINLRNCVARGEATFLRDNDLQSVRLLWENGLLATSERLFVAEGNSLEPRHEGRVDLTLDHVTAMTAAGLVLLANSQEAPYQLLTNITCNDCILATTGESPLIEQRGSDRIDVYQKRLAWYGNRDYFDGYDVFWLIMNSTGQSGSQQFDFDQWEQFWGAQAKLQSAGSGAVVWNQLPADGRPFHTHTPFDYRLDATVFENSAGGGGSNNSDAGCRFNDLPQPPRQPRLDDPADRIP